MLRCKTCGYCRALYPGALDKIRSVEVLGMHPKFFTEGVNRGDRTREFSKWQTDGAKE